MLSIQEMVAKTEKARYEVEKSMDATGIFHPQTASILNQEKAADRYELQQSLRNIPLSEFLAKSGTTGIAGAAYLVPDKIHDELIHEGAEEDICPLISCRIVNGWQGGDLKVNIANPHEYRAMKFSSGAPMFTQTVSTQQATLSPIGIAVPIRIAEDMIEDQAYDLMGWHISNAAKAIAYEANELALTVLKTATDGWGTVNGGASGDGDETKWSGATTFGINDTTPAKSIISVLAIDRWIPDTIIMTTEAWDHSVKETYLTLADNIPIPYTMAQPAPGFHCKLGLPPMDVLFRNSRTLCNQEEAGSAMTNCVTIVFDRKAALLTGRKRWMEIKNYVEPINDLAGAVVSCRQDSVTLYDDAIGVITET